MEREQENEGEGEGEEEGAAKKKQDGISTLHWLFRRLSYISRKGTIIQVQQYLFYIYAIDRNDRV